MIHNKREFAPVQFAIWSSSAAAWITMGALSCGYDDGVFDAWCSLGVAPWFTVNWFASASLGGLLMIVAMMAPITLPAIAHIRISTFVSRRARATLLFVVGFVAVWLTAGCAIEVFAMTLRAAAPESQTRVVCIAVVAFVWQWSPFKQVCLNRCGMHRSLCAFGRKADFDVLGFGAQYALWCVGTCWALMWLAMSLTQWRLAGMALVSVLVWCERLDAPKRPAWTFTELRTARFWLQREIVHFHRWVRERGKGVGAAVQARELRYESRDP